MTLQSEEPDGFGVTFKFDDLKQLIVEVIHSNRAADKVQLQHNNLLLSPSKYYRFELYSQSVM